MTTTTSEAPVAAGGIIRPAIVLFIALTVITGMVYPWLTTTVAQLTFPDQANGSVVKQGGRVVGSSLIGQSFTSPRYFWGRLSATAPVPYNGLASGGSNLGPTNPALTDQATARVQDLQKADPDQKAPIPVDLITASGSGLDPDISPEAAIYQVGRVARARGLPVATVQQLIDATTKKPFIGAFGPPTVNVLALNLALDRISASKP
jgi:K+-transporting ATPase ATPase C chain